MQRLYRSAFRVAAFLLPVFLATINTYAKPKEKIIHSFTGGKHGGNPSGMLLPDAAGNLYGVASSGGASQNGLVFELKPSPNGGWKESVLYNFAGDSDGSLPVSGVTSDPAGNLYGVTAEGGGTGCNTGCGTVYMLKPDGKGHWTEQVLYSFTGGADGAIPSSPLTVDSAGNVYGTTQYGGNTACDPPSGCGVVFELTPDQSGHWTQKVLHAFAGGEDGALPFLNGVIFDGSGNLYGATPNGGSADSGTVFEITPTRNGSWKEKVIYEFAGGSDGAFPAASLVFNGGSLYGTTYAGGNESGNCPNSGCGTVFQLIPGGGHWTKTTIFAFQGTDGIETLATPVFDLAGNLYGTTFEGGSGPCSVCGTAFELTPAAGQWQETVLHYFGSRRVDAGTPEAGVLVDSAGNVFGTTEIGGKAGSGALFEIRP